MQLRDLTLPATAHRNPADAAEAVETPLLLCSLPQGAGVSWLAFS
jgi:hypothetical protein